MCPLLMCKKTLVYLLVKLCLNSSWGYIGMRTNMPKIKIIDSIAQIVTMMTDPNINVTDLVPVNANLMLANYKLQDNIEPIMPNLSILIALFTTSHARLILYDSLQKLEPKQALYLDTDSILYCKHDDQPDPLPEGELLGEFKDELAAEFGLGSYATEFVSSGPKAYALKIKTGDGKTVYKILHKGIRRDGVAKKLLTLKNWRDALLFDRYRKISIMEQSKIHKDIKTGELYNKDYTKHWQIVSTKHCVNWEMLMSLPYGFYQMCK